MFIKTTFPLLLLCLFLSVDNVVGECAASSDLYFCPNTVCEGEDGSMLKDCLDCDDYLSTDFVHNICFDRVLFQPRNTNPDDPDSYYSFLWNDLVGAFVWFITAGVAISSGVGGGGVYAPLGIFVFRFSPKQV